MRTDELIADLASRAAPAGPRAGRLGLGAGAGALVGGALMLALFGLRPDLATAVGGFSFWMKAAYTASLSLGAAFALARLGRPEAGPTAFFWLLAAPSALLAGLAAVELAAAAPSEWRALILGQSARECPVRIVFLALPVFAGLVWAFRRLAPTRLRLAGAAAGLLAGAVGATVYGLHCPEATASFVAVWYTLGVGACALFGALAGPALLRW